MLHKNIHCTLISYERKLSLFKKFCIAYANDATEGDILWGNSDLDYSDLSSDLESVDSECETRCTREEDIKEKIVHFHVDL